MPFIADIQEIYSSTFSLLPPIFQNFVNFFFLAILFVFYFILIWKFYKFIAQKNFLEFDVGKYIKMKESAFSKILVALMYFIEYILVLPFLVFAIFGIVALFLIILSNNQNTSHILLISAIVVAGIRITSYYNEKISKEIALILPLNLLFAVLALDPDFFLQKEYFQKIVNQLFEIPGFIIQIADFLLFIIIIEIFFRFFDFIFLMARKKEESVSDYETKS